MFYAMVNSILNAFLFLKKSLFKMWVKLGHIKKGNFQKIRFTFIVNIDLSVYNNYNWYLTCVINM